MREQIGNATKHHNGVLSWNTCLSLKSTCFAMYEHKRTHDRNQVKLWGGCGKVAGSRDLAVRWFLAPRAWRAFQPLGPGVLGSGLQGKCLSSKTICFAIFNSKPTTCQKPGFAAGELREGCGNTGFGGGFVSKIQNSGAGQGAGSHGLPMVLLVFQWLSWSFQA